VIYALMLFRSGGEPPPGQGEAPDWFMDSFRTVLTYGSVGISLFVGWTLASRLAGIGFSQEGKNYWILKAAPVRAGHLLAAKFLVSYLPTLALGLLFLIVISILQGFSPAGFAYSLAIVALTLAGVNGILVGSGVAGANLNWDDPRKMNAGSMGCLGQLVAMIYLGVSFILFVGPLFVVSALQLPPMYGYLTGLIIGIVANLACALLPLMLVRKRVERLGEQ
jgi:hypothetical protein